MVIKIFFKGTTEGFLKPLNPEVNGLINKWLGEGNNYHGAFSRYCVSSMQGGKMDSNGVLRFEDGGYINVSSDDSEFIGQLMQGILTIPEVSVSSMKFDSMDVYDFKVNNGYDIIRTISPILLSNKDGVITVKDDSFIETLLDKSKKKLIKAGLDEKKVNTLTFELFHPENAKTKMVEIKSQKNIGSMVMLIVRGDKEVRRTLYELGLGKSTGFGFGAIEIR